MAKPARPSTIRVMTEAETAWVAGLLEGEGSFCVPKSEKARISVGMTDLDVLERLQVVVGGGILAKINTANGLGTKPMWRWHLAGQADVKMLTEALLPYLGQRRTGQAQAVLDALGEFVVREVGICIQGHDMAGRRACRTCVNIRRRADGARRRGGSQPAIPCTPT